MCFNIQGREGGGTSEKCTIFGNEFKYFCRNPEVSRKKKQTDKKQTGSKILVRNIPFQATVRELRELFW